ncbi:MAG TPA: hypothetical protein VMF06_23200 [Candidatus Limnocylindria bacterium]|jgi:hypothetical protein|nr:hypothetical protein [Candidatus Limnocylindria bacterium]
MKADLTVSVPDNIRQLIVSGPRETILGAIKVALDEENDLTLGATQERRLSFPKTQPSTMEGLRVQSNTLRKSLTRVLATIQGDAVFSAIGSNIKYFGVHEFGFEGTVEVAPFVRKRPDRVKLGDGQVVNLKTAARLGKLTKAGKARKGNEYLEGAKDIKVKAHTREVKLPARRMVQRTVEERLSNYANTLGSRIVEALGGAS